jgi:group I intron endonuclease
MYGLVYRVTNTANGKVYIGQTTMRLTKRWYYHRWEARRGRLQNPLYRAIRKYGEGCFTVVQIGEAESKQALDALEAYEMQRHDSMSSGYNAKEAGSAGKLSPEARKKMSESRTGEKHFNFGKSLSEDHKRKLSEAGRRRIVSDETRRKLSAAGTGRVFSDDTRRKIGASKKGHKMPDHVRQALKAANDNMRGSRGTPVICEQSGAEFVSMDSAAAFAGVSKSSMSRHVNLGQKLKSGLIFKRAA